MNISTSPGIRSTSGTYTPTWASSGTQPSIGNGTLLGTWYIDGNIMTVKIYMLIGTTTTLGTGTYSWSLPSGITSKSDGIPTAGGSAYTNAGGVAFSTATVACSAGATTVFCFTDGDGNTWGQTLPGAWANTNYAVITTSFPIA